MLVVDRIVRNVGEVRQGLEVIPARCVSSHHWRESGMRVSLPHLLLARRVLSALELIHQLLQISESIGSALALSCLEMPSSGIHGGWLYEHFTRAGEQANAAQEQQPSSPHPIHRWNGEQWQPTIVNVQQ